MYGIGIGRGLAITLKRFVSTFVNDLKWLGSRSTPETFAIRQGMQSEGIFTVEYPEEKIAVPERFRFVPFLVVNNHDDAYAPGHDWCTSCGICAKVCPPQCIWIVRGTDAQTGRPKPEPEAFYIDIDICMNCGYCAEYCPFDAIKMDHDYELASYDRTAHHIYDKKKLSKESRYWQTIAPTSALEEAERRGQWEHKDTLKVAKKAGIEMTPPLWDNRESAKHDPNIVTNKQAEQSRAAAQLAAPVANVAVSAAPATVTINLNVEGASPDQLAEWSADEGLPLVARSAAALRLDAMINNKEFKPATNHRKGVSAAKKAAKEANSTIEDLAKDYKPGAVVATAPVVASVVASPATPAPVVAPTSVATAPSVSINVESASSEQLSAWAGDESLPLVARAAAALKLEEKINSKEFKPSSADRKAISGVKKAAKDQNTTAEELAAGFTGQAIASVTAAAPVAAPTPTPSPAVTPPIVAPVAATPVPSSVNIEGAGPDQLAEMAGNEGLPLAIRATAALKLEAMINAKEFKPGANHRKAISAAKKAASDAGTTLQDAVK